MNYITFVLTTMVLNFILIITAIDFFEIYFAKCKRQNETFYKVFLGVYYVFSVGTVLLQWLQETNMIISCSLFLVLSFRYKSSFINRTVGIVFFMAILTLAEIIPAFMLSVLNEDVIMNIDETVTWTMSFTISRIIPFIIIKIYKENSILKNKYPNLSAKMRVGEGLIFILLPMCGVSIIYFMLKLVYAEAIENSVFVGVSMVSILGFIIIFYIIYIKNLEYIEFKTKEFLLNEQIEQYSKHYEELKDNLNEFYTYKHDVKYKLIEILSEFKIEDKFILEKFNMTFNNDLDYIYYSGNKSVDMMLNYKRNKAQNSNVNIKINTNSNLNINVDERTLCVLLGNMLDNAIEACVKFNKHEFEVEIRNQNRNLFISVENEYEGEIIIENNLPKTSKQNKEKHGKGIMSVKKLVEDNGGFLQIETNNNKFKMQIILINSQSI